MTANVGAGLGLVQDPTDLAPGIEIETTEIPTKAATDLARPTTAAETEVASRVAVLTTVKNKNDS